MSTLFQGRSPKDSSRNVLQSIKISSIEPIDDFQESIENYLTAQLKFCQKETAPDSDCPRFVASGGTELLSEHYVVARLNASSLGESEQYAVSVWALCNALWSDQEELEGLPIDGHLTITRRKELLSEWLEGVVAEPNSIKKSNSYLEHLLSLLSCHKVADACELALNNNDINLSFLLAQLSGGPTVRQLVQHQLSSWQDVEADKYIAVQRLKAMMLVAGLPLLSSSHGVINIFDNLDWLKSLAVSCL